MERWSGRVALVTGANSGIGAAIAEDLVQIGLKVVGLDLSTSNKLESPNFHPIKCDITQETELKEAFQWIKSNLGGVDVLVNSAGCVPINTLIDGPIDVWRKIFDLNVLALSVCTKEAIQSMKERQVDQGHIIHINSVLGHYLPIKYVELNMYSVSKHCVTALTEGLRREFVKENLNIRVSSVSPGVVKTDFPEESFLNSQPYLDVKDIADAVRYILATPPHVQIHELCIIPVGAPCGASNDQ